MTFTLDAVVADRGLDVSLNLGAAETVAILGPNGAGKSTLLSVIAGLIRPDSGEAALDGRALFHLGGGRMVWTPPHRRGTALLAQEALLFPHLTALDNVAFGPRSAGAGRAAAREVAARWLAEVEATDLAGRRPGELSGGQAQRVAVARALAADPGLLLLDEPMAALDVHAAPLLRRLLKRVLAGRRAIIVTHDVLDAYMLADTVVVLEGGRIVEQGPTRQVLTRPRSRFAAGLAGLNLVPGTITAAGLLPDPAGGGPGTPGAPGGQGGPAAPVTELAGRHEDTPVPGQAGVAAFPPSAVSVFPDLPHGSPRNAFAVTVTDLEPHGDQVRVRAGDLAADITPAASADLSLAPGVRAYFVVKAAAVSIYPA